jgi:phosphoglycolate phosphatase-like HAD superfamily hydrolase
VRLLLFDVDQTLISTGGAGIRALDRAFKHLLNLDNAMEGITPHGKTDPGIIREIFLARIGHEATMERELESILDAYVSFLRDEVQTSTTYRVLPGITEILESLSIRTDVLLGLATGNIEVGARIKLQRGNLNRFFAFGGYGSDSEDRTVLVRRAAQMAAAQHGSTIDPESTFVIGDTPRDIEAGLRAGFKTVGVATGRYTSDELRDAGAGIVVSNFRQDGDHFLRSTFIA